MTGYRIHWLRGVALLVALALLLVAASSSQAAPNATVVVKPSALNGWGFATTNNAVGSFVVGPSGSLGGGSAQYETRSGPGGKPQLATALFNGQKFADIATLTYQTYIQNYGSDTNHVTPHLNIGIDLDGNSLTTTDTATMVYEPCYNVGGCSGAVQPLNTWTTWNPKAAGQIWWSTKAIPGTDFSVPFGSYEPLDTLLAAHPNATITFFSINAGNGSGGAPWNNFVGNVDALTIAFGGGGATTYDFEAETPCTTVCYVNAATGNDSFGGDTPATAKKTIQAAIDTVSPGGTVRVYPGVYSETAANRTLTSIAGTYTFGLFVSDAKSGITVQGVDASDQPITSAAGVLATVNTNATNNFGPSGIFIEGDNVTLGGLKIGTNSAGQNKTIEVIGDAFTLKNSEIADPDGSVYLNDFRFDTGTNTSHVKSYTIDGNRLGSGVSLDIASGAGFSGPVSGHRITNNSFDLGGNTWPAISFTGSGTGVPWFVDSVGGAIITGNTFNQGAAQYIRARGTYDNTQFDWASYWHSNTYDKKVVVGPNPPADLRSYAYTSGPYTFTNVRHVSTLIQSEVDNGVAGDTVLVGPGTYTELVTVNKTLTLKGAQAGVDGRGRCDATSGESLLNDPRGAFYVQANTVVIDGFVVEGATANAWMGTGIYLPGGFSGHTLRNNAIRNNIFGLYLNSNGVAATLVERNCFKNNNESGAASGSGIYSDQGLSNAVVDANLFVNNTNAAILLTGTTPNAVVGVTVSNNQMDNRIRLTYSKDVTITKNTITNSLIHGVQLAGATSGITISQNTVTNATSMAVRIFDSDGVGPNTTSLIANNTFTGNTYGVVVADPGASAVITQNSIDNTTGGLGIDLDLTGNFPPDGVTPNDVQDPDVGPNHLQNFPSLGSAVNAGGATNVVGSLNSRPNKAYRIEFFSSPTPDPSGYGEGRTYLGSATVTTDGAGNAGFSASLAPAPLGHTVVAATATLQGTPESKADALDKAEADPLIQTSEFSAAIPIAQPGTIRVVLQTTPDGSPQVFSFQLFNPASQASTPFSLQDNGSQDFPGLTPGLYQVLQTVPSGWVLQGATCSDGSSPEAISLDSGETVTCAFFNSQGTTGVNPALSVRLYGLDNQGAGDPTILVEDPPYTDPEAPFDPQNAQAPRRDSLTWNPVYMSEAFTLDENQRANLYNGINSNNQNAAEKVYSRAWYEPDHLDKDVDRSGGLSVGDIRYPAIMQEWTYQFVAAGPPTVQPLPVQAPPGSGTSWVFPVGMRRADLFDASGNVITSGGSAAVGYGLTSLDADFDGLPDIVNLDSERSLAAALGVTLDLNNNSQADFLDNDGLPLSGDELVVFSVAPPGINVGGAAQFLDHVVVVEGFTTAPATVRLRIYWTGSIAPKALGTVLLRVGDAAVANNQAPLQTVTAGGSNLGAAIGAWFVYARSVDSVDGRVELVLGRGLGATQAAMESAPGVPNTGPNPWYTKRFYVDGVEYNTVAIFTQGTGAASTFNYITLRSPRPKFQDVVNNQFSVIQDAVQPGEGLGMLPPFNYEHYVVTDVQPALGFTPTLADTRFWGDVQGPVAPILQANQPLPYQSYLGPIYNDPNASRFAFVEETRYPPFLGELSERYGQAPGSGGRELEFWYTQQYRTLPDLYTAFVLPDNPARVITPELYLIVTNWFAPQAEYRRYVQGVTTPIDTTGGRAKFWFDPSLTGPLATKLYQDALGLRVYGRDNEGAGNTTPRTSTAPAGSPAAYLEVPPYTEVTSIFDPQSPQAPVKDTLTLNPAYMHEFRHGPEPLAATYGQIALAGVGGSDGGEKVFPRLWYEPLTIDTAFTAVVSTTGNISPTQLLAFPAVQQEMTYLLLDPNDQPAPTGPGGRFLFPVATGGQELPRPLTTNPNQFAGVSSFGYGLTSFDADFDGRPSVVRIETEASLNAMTGIGADFNANGGLDDFDPNGVQLSGDELVVLLDDGVLLDRSDPTRQSAQFLDHLVQVENVAYNQGTVTLRLWWTGGGLHPVGPGVYSKYPDSVGTVTLRSGDMVIVNRGQLTVLHPGQNNLGVAKGAWFAYVQAINAPIPGQPQLEGVALTVGRALGGAAATMYDGSGNLNVAAPTPWYLKRFYVDGHEYNVAAVLTVPLAGGGEGFKAITLRTPIPKEADVVNTPQSLVLQGYLQDLQFGVDTSELYVMPPFNAPHTIREDVRRIDPIDFATMPTDPDLARCLGPWRAAGALTARIRAEAVEPRFLGELRELPVWRPVTAPGVWSTEYFHTLPDRYTELSFPAGQYYLLTSDWETDAGRLAYRGCAAGFTTQDQLAASGMPIPPTNNLAGTYFQASPQRRTRVQFWYRPEEASDVYINPYPLTPIAPAAITGRVDLQGRHDDSGALVEAAGVSVTTGVDGRFSLTVPAGEHVVTVSVPGYLSTQTAIGTSAQGGASGGTGMVSLPPVLVLGGDANHDGRVSLSDLVIVAASYGTTPPQDPRADLNADATVGLTDLVLVAANYGRQGVQPWVAAPTLSATAAKRSAAQLSIHAPDKVKAGEEFSIVARVTDTAHLTAADVTLQVNARQVEVLDVSAGSAFDPAASFTARHDVDAAAGTARLVASRLPGSGAQRADGDLVVLRARAKTDLAPSATMAAVQLVDKEGQPLRVSQVK